MSCPAVLRCRTILTGVCLFLSVFLLSECKKENTSAYKVIDSGIWPYGGPIEKTFWLDNERVLFISNKTLAPGGPESKVMTIWNTKTNKIDFSHKVENITCVQNKQVFFYVKDDATGKYKNYRGTLDNPKEHPAPGPNMRIDDRFDCDWSPKFSRAKVPYKIKLKDANYLEIIEERLGAPVFSQGKTRYYETLNKPSIPLPVYVGLEGSYTIRFNQLRNAYFISTRIYKPKDIPNDPYYYHSMWWMSRDGRLTQVPFPQAMLKGRLTIYPLKKEYLVDYNSGKYTATDPGDRGLWLLDGDKVLRLIVGAVHGISVSPDGCRVAFIHAKNTKEYLSWEKQYRTIKLINFCEGRK
jgi:hypothetical protein